MLCTRKNKTGGLSQAKEREESRKSCKMKKKASKAKGSFKRRLLCVFCNIFLHVPQSALKAVVVPSNAITRNIKMNSKVQVIYISNLTCLISGEFQLASCSMIQQNLIIFIGLTNNYSSEFINLRLHNCALSRAHSKVFSTFFLFIFMFIIMIIVIVAKGRNVIHEWKSNSSNSTFATWNETWNLLPTLCTIYQLTVSATMTIYKTLFPILSSFDRLQWENRPFSCILSLLYMTVRPFVSLNVRFPTWSWQHAQFLLNNCATFINVTSTLLAMRFQRFVDSSTVIFIVYHNIRYHMTLVVKCIVYIWIWRHFHFQFQLLKGHWQLMH